MPGLQGKRPKSRMSLGEKEALFMDALRVSLQQSAVCARQQSCMASSHCMACSLPCVRQPSSPGLHEHATTLWWRRPLAACALTLRHVLVM